MKPIFSLVLLSATLVSLGAQAQGVQAPWDISQTIQSLSEQTERLTPVLAQLTPEQWQAKGAPAAYADQWRAAQSEVGYLARVAQTFAKQPEKLTLALETLFRLQAVEAQVTSLVEGVRRYQNPAIGDLLVSVVAANSSNRDQLRQYATDLAAQKEQELQVMDQEAQRCRGMVVRQAPTRPAAPKPAAPKPAAN